MTYAALTSKIEFPILSTTVQGKPLVYLDSAATTQRPEYVISKVNEYLTSSHANASRSSHFLGIKATEHIEEARQKVKDFIHADKVEEIIFTKSATESLNMVASSYGMAHVEEGDDIILLISEHHANLLPWQQVARVKKANLRYVYLKDNLEVDMDGYKELLTARTKIVAIGHISNVLGIINPVEEMARLAHEVGAVVVVDGTQSVPHMPVDVRALDADFFVFSGHKMLAPMGIGVLYGKLPLLEKMDPYLYGGSMIEYVEEQSATFAAVPARFEAGTPNIEGIVGLGAAIDYLQSVGLQKIREHDEALTKLAIAKLKQLPYIQIVGEDEGLPRGGVVSFNVEGIHPHDVGSILDASGIAIRVGHHCANPLISYLKVPACCRASFYLYNSEADIDALIEGLKTVRKVMRLEY